MHAPRTQGSPLDRIRRCEAACRVHAADLAVAMLLDGAWHAARDQRTALDCADVCAALAGVVARGEDAAPALTEALAEAAAVACRAVRAIPELADAGAAGLSACASIRQPCAAFPAS